MAGDGGPFAALGHRNYRLLWLGTLVSNSGDWMDQVALNWLVLQTTDSPFYLGLVNFSRGIPILLFTLLGGVAADRVERRRLMMITQSVAMALAFLLAGLVYFDVASIALVLAIATCRGIVISFNLPARHSLISSIVPKDVLPNAIALNSVTINMTKIVGPAVAGLLIGFFGTAVCFAVNGLSFLAVLWTLQVMRIPPSERVVPVGGIAKSVVEGISYVRSQRTILLLVLIALVPTFFGQPYLQLLAVFAHDVFEIGPDGLGLLTSCAAIGSVGGGLLLATFPRRARRGTTMIGFMIAFGLLLVVFACNPTIYLAPVILVGVGAMHIAYNASNNTILQMSVADDMRGRVLSVLFLNRGLVQLGTAFAATLASVFGVRLAVASTAGVIVVLGIVVMIYSPVIRRLEV